MATVHYLPSELLADIIFILHEEIVNTEEHGFSARWIPATWVCRRWRDAALQKRQLWTKLHTRRRVWHPEAVQAFLSRAPDTAIVTVDIEGFPPLGADARPLPGAEAGRADVFEYLHPWAHRMDLTWSTMVEDNSGPDAQISRVLGALAPALTFLWVDAVNYGDPNDNPFTLYAHGLPNLRKIVCAILPSASDPIPGVTYSTLYKATEGEGATDIE